MTDTATAALVYPEPPSGNWRIWLLEGDRSTGKTTCGARWLLAQALEGPEGSRWAVCAPTWFQARNSLEALIDQAAPGDVKSYGRTTLDLVLRNDARIKGFSAEAPDRIRGYNLAGAWFDDAEGMRDFSFYREGLLPAVRTGKHPRLLVTATVPERPRLICELEALAAADDGEVCLTRA